MAALSRRLALVRLGSPALLPGLIGAQRPSEARAIARPVLFDTPEADRILADLQVFPSDNPWNLDISRWPLHPNSKKIIASIGADKPLRHNTDMAFVLVPTDQPRVTVKLTGYSAESDEGPFPVPDNLPIEGWPVAYRRNPRLSAVTLEEVQRDKLRLGGDRHAIVVDPIGQKLYEFFVARRTDAGWEAAQCSIFNLASNRLRPDGWTSADAAGLPIFPAVVRHDEIERGIVRHALRVTVAKTRRAYVHPATHYASQSQDPNLPRMGERIRLRKGFATEGFSRAVRTVLEALKRHGMFVADNGLDWALSVAPDPRIPAMHDELRRVKGADFEVVQAPK
jgi:hypothetical protein